MKSSPTPEIKSWGIEPVGDRCILVRLGEKISLDVSQLVHAAATYFSNQNIPGLIDIVPAFTTVALYFQPTIFDAKQGTASTQLKQIVEDLIRAGVPPLPVSSRMIEIPACYGGVYGPDLLEVAAKCAMEPEEVIKLHSETSYSLYTFFFSPGNPYAGPLDSRLHVPRRNTPRLRVEAGSIAIANSITAIYQMASPGGWSIIARTPYSLFDVTKTPPTRLQLGDQIRFVPISEQDLEKMQEHKA